MIDVIMNMVPVPGEYGISCIVGVRSHIQLSREHATAGTICMHEFQYTCTGTF